MEFDSLVWHRHRICLACFTSGFADEECRVTRIRTASVNEWSWPPRAPRPLRDCRGTDFAPPPAKHIPGILPVKTRAANPCHTVRKTIQTFTRVQDAVNRLDLLLHRFTHQKTCVGALGLSLYILALMNWQIARVAVERFRV